MSYNWGSNAGVPTPSDAPYGRAPSGRPYKRPPVGWVPPSPGAPFPGGKAPAPPPQRERSYVWAWVLGGCAALLTVVVVVGLVVVTRVRDAQRLNAAAAATTIKMPPRAGGLVRSTDPTVVAVATKAVATFREGGFPKSQAAGYARSPKGPLQALAMGTSAPVANPQKELLISFRTARRAGFPVIGTAAFPPGPLGGSLQCGAWDNAAGSVCGWADHGSIVMVIVVGLAPDKAAPLVLRMRANIEHRS